MLLVFLTAAWAGGSDVKLSGTLEVISGATAVWQIPPSPVGVLFLAHGCNHRATDFFPKTTSCSSCIGLPEEVRISKDALAAHLAVIAISSVDEDSRCWSIHEDGEVHVSSH